jgi:hypothetical protein
METFMSAQVISILRGFDPLSAEAEERYDRVASRMNQLSAARNWRGRMATELERQFVENQLIATSGKRRGQTLTSRGRKRRLTRLFDLRSELDQITSDREHLSVELEAMNDALEVWARETYGGTLREETELG